MIKQLFKVKTLSAVLLSAFMVIAVSSFNTLQAQTTTTQATAQGANPSDVDQLGIELKVILNDIQNNSSLNEMQKEVRIVLYENVLVYVRQGLSVEQGIEYALNIARESVKNYKDPHNLDFNLIRQEAENYLL